ncbi:MULTISPECIES: hypothetical protein [Acetobacterium]|uniref:Uncharacterized protein n=1 Tax=Acetobacterium wieringae TaxID=52694 RepID=A0A1F2PKJ7_9FIRM|nr:MULTISPECIES: hypothetical protein [Acetobacterium]OFV71414.1 hypothetical protein ACWI_11430 [Acetobacterium wieringae]
MKKNEFLTTSVVQDFMHWLEQKMDQADSFCHGYQMKKPNRPWECHSIYSAYENYCWPFRFHDPITEEPISGQSFDKSALALSSLSQGLRRSLEDGDPKICRKHCYAVLQWGGVLSNNDKRIDGLGDEICDYLKQIKTRLADDRSSGDYYQPGMIMNAGFTKIYSLCMDDFIIYDGRVGAALGLLVRKFCEAFSLAAVPDELAFAWGKGKESAYKPSAENRRNPGSKRYPFPELSNNPKRHTENNIRANWLIRELADQTESEFKKLDHELRIRAMEAALFMIGYQVKGF